MEEQPKEIPAEQPEITPEPIIEGPVAWEDTIIHDRYDDVYLHIQPGTLAATQTQGNAVHFRDAEGFEVQVESVSARIFRMRYTPPLFEEADFSYALTEQEGVGPAPELSEATDHWKLQLGELQLQINRSQGLCEVKANDGTVLLADAAPYRARRYILNGIEEVRVQHKMPANGQYYGLGDKSGPFQLNGCAYENWNTDAYAYGPESDPLYKTIPFYLVVQEGRSYGIFLDNSYRSFFDFGQSEEGIVRFGAKGGTLSYYFIYGDTPEAVVTQYTQLTGLPELPPLWALGFHQCRWSYYPEARVREVCREFRERRIPCDAIYLDIDYMDGFRCFTWNQDYFPQPTQMIKDLKADGFQTVVMIDPGLKADPNYPVFQDGMERDYFCRRTNGELFLGPVWPQDCVFPEFTRPEVRAWWGRQYRELYKENDIAGFWNDMNEPAVFKVRRLTFPDEVQHHYDGHPTDHRKTHNIYGMQMARATYEGLRQLKPEKRPFVITRATFSGGQRYSFAWTGDNIASWEHLRIANTQNVRMCISGFSLTGSDIGGFVDQPEPELLIRWLQLGIFHPLFRVHSMGNNEDGASEINEDLVHELEAQDRMDQEPWAFGPETEALAKAAIELRYSLLPYLYTLCYELAKTGRPVLKPTFFADPTDAALLADDYNFLFGDQLLAAPVQEAGRSAQSTYLPKGQWYPFQDNQLLTGQQAHNYPVTLGSVPLFVRAGSVIPRYPIVQSTADLPGAEWYLDIYWLKGSAESRVFEDSGEGYAYRSGWYVHRTLNLEGQSSQLEIGQKTKGQGTSPHAQCVVTIYGLPFTATSVSVDGRPQKYNIQKNKSLQLRLSSDFKTLLIR
ncbi:MAG: DUF4968 domain-containing protein [Phaeodactylibacter sp.]|nr:DUF4968 domain-containing protein [Phaeodactylibacter sp.]